VKLLVLFYGAHHFWIMKHIILTWLCLCASQGAAQDVFILGEQHDNPHHHVVQADRIREINPNAVVFEMLDDAQAAAINALDNRSVDQVRAVSDWDASGWPAFDIYAPVFDAVGARPVIGAAVPRDQARKAFADGISAVFTGDADRFGLTRPLAPDEQAEREAMQFAAHCDALPKDMLPMMVDVQRLRDATLALRIEQAVAQYGSPVAVVTGNGHARRDWGIAQYLKHSGLEIHALGQGEEGVPPNGAFDEIVFSSGVERDDPCAAFAKN